MIIDIIIYKTYVLQYNTDQIKSVRLIMYNGKST